MPQCELRIAIDQFADGTQVAPHPVCQGLVEPTKLGPQWAGEPGLVIACGQFRFILRRLQTGRDAPSLFDLFTVSFTWPIVTVATLTSRTPGTLLRTFTPCPTRTRPIITVATLTTSTPGTLLRILTPRPTRTRPLITVATLTTTRTPRTLLRIRAASATSTRSFVTSPRPAGALETRVLWSRAPTTTRRA